MAGILLPVSLYSQLTSPFTGDPARYREELTAFMGPNLKEEHKANLSLFLNNWDNGAFSQEDMTRIIDVTSQFYGRSMRPVPHMDNFLLTLNTYIRVKGDSEFLSNWLRGLSEIVFSPRIPIESINRYIVDSKLAITDNTLTQNSTIRWKVKNSILKFTHDTVFKIIVTNATLVCYSQKDSTEIYNVSGTYFPEILEFHGDKGIITWEKAGYPRTDVFAEIKNFKINTSKNNFSVDSAKLTHNTYFKMPVYGLLTDEAIAVSNKEKAYYPRFETYTKEFTLKNIYKGVNYRGGLLFEGATVKGSGSSSLPARITIYRNDTIRLNVISAGFVFSKKGFVSQEASVALYLEKDSIYHSNLALSYVEQPGQINLYRANNPVSKSPYYDSYHSLDMSFELLSWNLKDSNIILSRSMGASIGHALFESSSFFDAGSFMQMAGIDEYHPLIRLKKFSEWYYSETFPVEEFAKWLGKPVEAVTGLCIDMANKGFIFYDRTHNEITLKKKVDDYLNSYAKKKDYDIIRIISETKAPVDNAILNIKNNNLTVNGVKGVFLSDSQRVALYPYNGKLIIDKNRDMKFNGMVEAGLFTVYGHNFSFSYDTFKIKLGKIDSIRVAVETENKDRYGNPLIKNIENIIQMTSAELYIDDPRNKSGLRSLKQYPIINSTESSYIFYNKMSGLENVYPQKDFYFRIDPFIYENIDHFKISDVNMPGEFRGGNILEPMKMNLIIKDSSSFGFNIAIPEEGLKLYGGKARLYDSISMDNKGLRGKGILKYLSSTTISDEFKLFPDSVLAEASSFNIERDNSGLYPPITSNNVTIKWLTKKDEWLAMNSKGKNFKMFENGTELDGYLSYSPKSLKGSGILNTPESRITSKIFNFTSNTLKADTSDYFLKSPSTGGYAFIAENVQSDVSFALQRARLRQNTNTSFIKFPEVQYICKMNDLEYDMNSKILRMEQKGSAERKLLTPEQLIRVDTTRLEKPTFFATNVIRDTISFASSKGTYHLDGEYIEAENINYIRVADALIQPENGKITIGRRAKINQIQNAIVAINNRHLLHSAKIDIQSTKKYSGSAVYDYIDETKEVRNIFFPELTVDTMTTSAKGYIPASQNFLLSPAFSFTGDVYLHANKDLLLFTGAAGITHNCDKLKSYSVKFKSYIDPRNIIIPVSDKPRDVNDNPVYTGSYINIDSLHIYPAFLSEQKSWIDVAIVNSRGYLWYDKARGRYLLTSLEKIADPSIHGDMIALDRNYCILSGEGKINLGTNFGLANMTGAGKIVHNIDSGKVEIQTLLGFDFYFSPEALTMMSDRIRLVPSLKPVNLNSELYNKGMKDLLGVEAANRMKEDLNLFGVSRELPASFNYELFLNDVTLYWNDASSSFRSRGKIGLGFAGIHPVNVYVDGFIEIQRRRSGDMFDIYLKANESTWYYFSYVSGNMMAQSGDLNFNTLIANTKQKARKHPDSSGKIPYTYMIAVEDRLGRFLRRMEEDEEALKSRGQDEVLRGIVR